MAVNQFDENGLTLLTYDELRTAIANAVLALPGCSNAGVDDEDTTIGKLISILAELFAGQNDLIAFIHACYDPSSALGVALQRLVLLNGLKSGEGSKSTVTLTCTSNAAGCTIPAGSIVCDPNNSDIKYETDSALVLSPDDSDTVTATCTTDGYNTGAADTLTQIDTPVYGWSTVTNASAITPGTNEETGTALRRRRDLASRRYGVSTLAGVWSELEDVDNVDDVFIKQNLTLVTDEYDIPARAMKAIVDGGTDADVAECLFTYAPVRTVGDDSAIHSWRGHDYTIYFQRPTETSLDIELTFAPLNSTTPATWPEDGEDTVNTAVLAWVTANQKIAIDAVPKAIAGAAAVIDGYYVSLCEICEHGGTPAETVLTADIDEKYITQADYITVVVS